MLPGMEFWEGLDEPEHAAELVSRPELVGKTPAEDAEERLDAEVDGIFRRNLRVLDDVAHFRDIDPAKGLDQPPPSAWIEELGEEEAQKRLRLALAGWMNQKQAPVGFRIAADVVGGVLKVRAQRGQQGKQPLLVAMVSMPAPQITGDPPTKQFPRQKVGSDE